MKTKRLLVLSAGIMLTSLISYAQGQEIMNPYAIFGSTPYIAGDEQHTLEKVFVIDNSADSSKVGYMEHDPHTGLVRVFDKEGNLTAETQLEDGQKAWFTIDRYAEKYYPVSPYAYVANNPMKFIDMNGDSLRYTGIAADVQSVVDVHNNDLGGFYNVLADNNGMVSISAGEGKDPSKMNKGQNNYYNYLNTVVADQATTQINVTNNSSNVLIGDVLTSTIDIGDIQKLSPSSLPVTQGAALMHEVWEQFEIQAKGVGSVNAHGKAVRIESQIIGVGVESKRFLTPSPPAKTGYMDVKSSAGNATIYYDDFNITRIKYPK